MVRKLLTMGVWGRGVGFVVLAALCWLAAQSATGLRIDRSDDSLISKDHPGWSVYNRMVEDFGVESSLLIYARADDLWSTERLKQLEYVVAELGDLPGVISVDSIFTATNIRDKGDFVDAGPLVDTVPDEPERIAELKADALYSPLMVGSVISADGTGTAISVTFEADTANPNQGLEIFDQIETTIAPLRNNFDPVFQVGNPRLMVEIDHGLFRDLSVLIPVAAAVMIVVIVLFLRSATCAVVPLLTSGITLLWTLGFMAALDIPLTLMTAVIPALIIVIGSVEDVHLISSYLEGIGRQKVPNRQAAVAYMARRVGLPIVITSLTTAIGFATNAVTDIPLIREFAIASAFAMIANLVVTVLVVPLILGLVGPLRTSISSEDDRPRGVIGKIVDLIEWMNERHASWVVGATVALLIGFGFMIPQIQVSNDPLSYFENDHPFVIDANILHDDLSGLQIFSVILDSETEGTFRTPEGLAKLTAVQALLDGTGVFDKTQSHADMLALMHQEMNKGDPAYLVVPENVDDIDLYLLSFRREDLSSFVTEDYTRARIIVRHNLTDSMKLNRIIEGLETELPGILGPDIAYAASGKNLMINDLAETLVSGQLSSLLLVLVIILAIFSFMYTSFLAGLLSLVPNIIPVILNFGLMGLMGMPLNPGTAMVAAIAIGVAIDDTVHLMTRYGAECRKQPDQALAARNAIRGEAVPVISTSIGLALGFAALTMSEFGIIAQFGALAAATMIYALLTDLLIMPIFLRHLRLATVWDIVALKIDREVLVRCPLFDGMSRYQVRKVVVLSDIQEFAPGEVIVQQGTKTTGMYVVLQGAGMAVLDDGDTRIDLGRFTPGQVFGEIGFSGEGVERTATVTASEPTTVVRLDADSARKGLRHYPRIAARLYRNIGNILGERLGDANRRLVNSSVAVSS